MDKLKIEMQEELLEVAPQLARMRERHQKSPYVADDTYFASLQTKVLAQLDLARENFNEPTQPLAPEKGISPFKMRFQSLGQRRTVYAIAASFLLVAGMVWLLPKSFNTTKNKGDQMTAVTDYSQFSEEEVKSMLQDCKIDGDFLTNELGLTEKDLTFNILDTPEKNKDENLNEAIDSYIRDTEKPNNL